jgi:DnaJ-class molecular chaperone
MTDMSKYKNVSLTKETYATLDKLSKVLLPDAKLSIAKTIESIANEKVKKLNGKIKKGRIKIHICETCHGNGYVRVAKLDGDPSVDFRDRSEVHQCWDCDSEGEYYETISDGIIDDGNSNSVH